VQHAAIGSSSDGGQMAAMRDANSANDLVQRLKPAIMTLRIIVVALATGVVAFAVTAIVIRVQQAVAPANDTAELLTTLGIVAAPVAFLLSRFVPGLIVATSRRQIASGQYGSPAESNPHQTGGPQSSLRQLGDDGKLFTVYQTKTIISAALLEGAAFLNIVAYLLGGSPIALGLGLLLALAIVALFPRNSRVVEWIEGQRRLMAEEKLLAR
jgi:hypothetical protein